MRKVSGVSCECHAQAQSQHRDRVGHVEQKWLDEFDRDRRHSSINDQTPDEAYRAQRPQLKKVVRLKSGYSMCRASMVPVAGSHDA